MQKEKEMIFTKEDLFKAMVFHQAVFEYTVQKMLPTYFYVTNFYSVLKNEFPADIADALFQHIHKGKTFKEKYNECKAYDMNAWYLGQERQREVAEQLDNLRRE
jgi:hypothetical protein